MIERVRVPQLSANIEQASVTEWLKQEGDTVEKGEPLVELQTEKANFECESTASGQILKVFAEQKSVLPVGYILAIVGTPGEALPDIEAENRELIEKQTQQAPRRRQRREGGGERGKRVRATPAARRLARELSVDLSALSVAAEGGPVTEAMVRMQAGKQDS